MRGKIIRLITCAAAASSAMFAFPLCANATTVDDVAAVARQYGISEDDIMKGYNKYYEDPDLYTEEDFDLAIERIKDGSHKLITTGPQNPDAFTTTTTTTAVTTTAAPKTDKNGSTVTTVTTTAPKNTGEITLTLSDGSTFIRMSTKDFIKLSYADKMAYLSTFTPEQQQTIIDNLTPEEYRSLLKQAPQSTKLSVIDELSTAADAMGLNITVEEISDDSISVAMRNDDGELVGYSHAGSVVEDTGYDRSNVFKAAGALILAAAAVMAVLVKKCFGKEKAEE